MKNRAHQVLEAVLAGLAPPGRPPLNTIVQVFYRHMLKWAMNQPSPVVELAKTLVSDPDIKKARIVIEPLKHPSKFSLFPGAAYDSSNGKVIIQLNPNFIFENEKRLLQHLSVLQSTLQHEYTHAEQFSRKATASPFEDNMMVRHGSNFDQSFHDYRREIGNTSNAPERIARNISVGIPYSQQDVGQWYQSQPEEIMAWAVEIGSLMAQIEYKELPPTSIPVLTLRRSIGHILTNLGHNQQSPAMNKFKRHLVDYLVQHQNYPTQKAVQDITRLFQEGRR